MSCNFLFLLTCNGCAIFRQQRTFKISGQLFVQQAKHEPLMRLEPPGVEQLTTKGNYWVDYCMDVSQEGSQVIMSVGGRHRCQTLKGAPTVFR